MYLVECESTGSTPCYIVINRMPTDEQVQQIKKNTTHLRVMLKKWAISHLERIRDGIFPPWVAKPRRREKKFPHEWLSRNSERVFPHERRSREWGNSFSLWLLSHECGNFPIPNSLQMRYNIPMLKGKLHPKEWRKNVS